MLCQSQFMLSNFVRIKTDCFTSFTGFIEGIEDFMIFYPKVVSNLNDFHLLNGTEEILFIQSQSVVQPVWIPLTLTLDQKKKKDTKEIKVIKV